MSAGRCHERSHRTSQSAASVSARSKRSMKVLVIDVGGTHVKILATGQKLERRMDSSPALTARQMVSGVRALAKGWKYDAVSIGYPGPVQNNRPVNEPYNLGKGWVDLDYDAALGCPVKMVNDAAM